ncbi:uncharacterized protein V6R79_017400 [Siganus canaliculatus]
MLENTNLQGTLYSRGWSVLEVAELRAFFGLLLLGGLCCTRGEITKTLWSGEGTSRPIFGATMPRYRFEELAACLRFDDWETCHLATGELWILADTGKDVPARRGRGKEMGLGRRVVLELTEGLPAGHTIVMDNFFTSFALGEELAQRRLTMLGTIRRNKPELPPALLVERQREVLSSVFAHTATCTAVSYLAKGKERKLVLLLSTRHRQAEQVLRYSCKRKTKRWPLCLFYHLLDMACYNAFVLWSHIAPSWKRGCTYRRRLFMSWGKPLSCPGSNREPGSRAPFARAYVEAVREKAAAAEGSSATSPGRSESGAHISCSVWPPPMASGRRQRRVCTKCFKCGKPACKEHTVLVCNNCAQ